jgi:hypothetical protein
MRRTFTVLTLALSFIAPLAMPIAAAAEPSSVHAQNTACKGRRAKKQSEAKPKKKDKDKDKKAYGFEL